MGGFTSAAAAAKDVKTSASDTLLKESTGVESTNSGTWTTLKAIGIPSNRVRTTIRTTFTLKSSGLGDDAIAKIYINGVATGTQRTTGASTYQTYTEDFTIQDAAVLIELKVTNNAGQLSYTDNLSIKGTETEIDQDYEVVA